jgi:hypothetical protein
MEVARDDDISVQLDKFVEQDKERDLLLRVRIFLRRFMYQLDFKISTQSAQDFPSLRVLATLY